MREEPFFSNVRVRWEDLDRATYPGSVPAVKALEDVRFHPAVTYFVGENATGKSTIIEAIALAAGFNAEGGTKNFKTRDKGFTNRILPDAMTLVRSGPREKDGFFLRAESTYVLASYVRDVVDKNHPPVYGGNLHAVSHGESFMQIFSARFRNASNCLFILDEVESALSPQRQLEFLALMHTHVARGSQFIVSTHSPILMAYPHSRLYWLTPDGMSERNWKETDHFQIYEAWIRHPEKMVKILTDQV